MIQVVHLCPMQWTLSILSFCFEYIVNTLFLDKKQRQEVERMILPGTSGHAALYEACVNGEQVQPGP